MRRLGLTLEVPDLCDEVYYALAWWGESPVLALARSREAACCKTRCRWARCRVICGAQIVTGSVVATDGVRAVVVVGRVKSTLPAEWATLGAGWSEVSGVVGEVAAEEPAPERKRRKRRC